MTDKRIVQVYSNGIWIESDMTKIVEGDRFRLFESTGEAVIDSKGRKEWVAASSPHEKYGDWAVDIY